MSLVRGVFLVGVALGLLMLSAIFTGAVAQAGRGFGL